MMLWTDLGFLDLFDFDPADPSLPVDGLFDRSVEDAEGLRYASREDLKRMKVAGGRTKDLLDLEALDTITPPPTPRPHP
jgi:hypothetical protein